MKKLVNLTNIFCFNSGIENRIKHKISSDPNNMKMRNWNMKKNRNAICCENE